MPLEDWLFIDAEMDNAGALSRHEFHGELYDPQRAARADAIRKVGWEMTGHITRPIADAGRWPPSGDVMRTRVTISLSMADWGFVSAELRRGVATATDVGHTGDADRGSALAERLDGITSAG